MIRLTSNALGKCLSRFVAPVAAVVLMGLPVWAGAVELNTASLDELRSVKGVGPRTAELIVRERDRSGPYQSLEDLSERVRGIGAKKAQRLADAGLTVTLPQAAPKGAAAVTPPKAVKR